MSEKEKYAWEDAADDLAWDGIVAKSPQGTLFSESVFLKALERPVARYLVRLGQVVKAAVCVFPGPGLGSCELDDLAIHAGIMFIEDKKPVRLRCEQFAITEFVLSRLDGLYPHRIEMALSPQFADLRPFLWFNYGSEKPGATFSVDLRYTAYIDISSLRDQEADSEASACFQNMLQRHRYEIRVGLKNGARVEAGAAPDRMLDFYEKLMARQGAEVDRSTLERMESVVRALTAVGRGRIYTVHDTEGVDLYSVFYGWDDKRGYYLYGAGNPDKSASWQGSVVHWGAFQDLARSQGLAEIDVEGINSPARGWFKLGFGAELKPYFHALKGGSR